MKDEKPTDGGGGLDYLNVNLHSVTCPFKFLIIVTVQADVLFVNQVKTMLHFSMYQKVQEAKYEWSCQLFPGAFHLSAMRHTVHTLLVHASQFKSYCDNLDHYFN